MSRRLDRLNREPSVIPYRGFFICRVGVDYFIKRKAHHRQHVFYEGFRSVETAKETIDWYIVENIGAEN